ncbi:WD repeat-containing protein [Verticillium alfalfae VaMs.102]|uniref:WD repeat-containing protein n=1 Tax=Verticillium alfalfae (strain VaMs.102 / ATCC MYA-4576 / FGSC 10136) TaxID=526221 RepID=C9SR86_VERA1|nr:WD repeat-containing protein [Verticillium alfalfae VaMs.102]EEY20888.1 WD repeat-containing protein [Verticillium alfalfae VaMs.102]
MASTPMDLDRDAASTNGNSLNITRNTPSSTSRVSDVISSFRPTKLFRREDIKDGRSTPHILSLDFDDPGELLMTSESDETIQIYNVREGRHEKSLLSKKYGVKLAKFTHTTSSIIYASTKQNDQIRYLATHDNSFIRYFEGHEKAVTSIAVHPGTDNFISCAKDDTVRLWDIKSKQWCGQLFLNQPTLAAYDPSGNVFGVASPASGSVLLYDCRNFDKAPFAVFDVVDAVRSVDKDYSMKGWTKLEFSNDGKHILLGTRGNGHFLLDAFDGHLKAYLRKPEGGTRRRAAGESAEGFSAEEGSVPESSGDCSFTVMAGTCSVGSKKGCLGMGIRRARRPMSRVLDPSTILEGQARGGLCLLGIPRYNFFATADQEVLFWVPDPHA